MKMKAFRYITACLLLALLSVSARALPPRYSVIDLGTLGGTTSWARAVNSSGWVVGESKNASGVTRAFLWRPGMGMTDLGTLGGASASAQGINDSGQVVGYADNASGYSRAFLWSPGAGMTDLGTLGGVSAGAWGINHSGQVVGLAFTVAGAPHPFLWSGTAGMSDLGTLQGGYGAARAISGSGLVVGESDAGGEYYHAFLWQAGQGMTDLSTFGGSESGAWGVNDSGQVVGWAEKPSQYPEHEIPGPMRAFLWEAGTGMVDLGDFGGTQSGAYGINNLGQVVGWATDANSVGHPFLWEPGTGLTDLNTLIDPASGWNLSSLDALNDNGWIVGYGVAPNRQTRAFLLQPVPEPSGFLVFGVSALALPFIRGRRKNSR